MILCGLGGIHTEILRDFAMRRAPVDRETAAEMLGELRGYKLLEGARGSDTADIDALIDAIVSLSNVAVRASEELVNPLSNASSPTPSSSAYLEMNSRVLIVKNCDTKESIRSQRGPSCPKAADASSPTP